VANPFPSDSYERPHWTNALLVAGVDEAGRGALAGPVVAAAVILDPTSVPSGLRDSKLLTAAARERLSREIKLHARCWHVCAIGHGRIDDVNILQATFDAMHGAIDGLSLEPSHLLIDGNRFRPYHIPHTTIISGDSLSVSIAAASILAKVFRDAFMRDLALAFPVYGFERHKGYGTVLHRTIIRQHGASDVHRRTFLKNI